MKTLVSTPLFGLLAKAPHTYAPIVGELDAAYDGFVRALDMFCERDSTITRLMRTLCYTQLDLHFYPIGMWKNKFFSNNTLIEKGQTAPFPP